jgi:hypothetical protein
MAVSSRLSALVYAAVRAASAGVEGAAPGARIAQPLFVQSLSSSRAMIAKISDPLAR